MTDFDIQVRLYAPGGDAIGVLDTLEISATLPTMMLGTLKCTLSRVLVPSLPDVIEAALEYWDADAADWIEPRDARYMLTNLSDDERDPARAVSLEGVTLWDWMLRKAIVKPGDGDLLASGHRPFNSATGGAILKTLIDEAQDRGWGPSLTYDFTASLDSNGDPWDEQITIAFEPGRTNVLMVLDNLVAQGMIERRTEGRLLRLFNPGSGERLDEGDAPVKLAADASQMPLRRSIDDLVTDLSFYGEDGFTLELENSGAYAGLGRLETALVQGGVSDEGTATLLGQTVLTQGKQARMQISATEPAALAVFLPWIHYNAADWVLGIRADGSEDPFKAYEIVVRKSNPTGEIVVSATLNDRFEDLLSRLAKRTNGILGGAVAGGSGSVPVDGADTRKPKAPEGLTGISFGYYDADGASKSQVTLDWTDVTQGENDVAIDVQGYAIWARPDDGATPSQEYTTTLLSEGTASPFEPGTSWIFKVRAESAAGVWGEFSDETDPVLMLDADPALEKPVAPIVTSARGIALVATNGLFDTDPPTTAPSWFREFRIERSQDIGADYLGVGTLNRTVDVRSFNDMGIGDTWYFRLVPVDRLGRDGTPSDPTPVTILGIDGADLIVDSIQGNRIVAGTLSVDRVEPGFGDALEISGNVTIVATQATVADVAADVTTVAGDVATVAETVDLYGTYFDFAPAGLGVSAPGTDYSQLIAADGTTYLQGTNVIVEIADGQMTAQAIVVPTAKIGNHQFEKAPANAGTVMRALL
jgi:hypothetical protein